MNQENLSNEEIAKELVKKGLKLSYQDKHEEAITAYDEVVQRFGNDDSHAVREQVAEALATKGYALYRLENLRKLPLPMTKSSDVSTTIMRPLYAYKSQGRSNAIS